MTKRFEKLEPRLCFASAWQNPQLPLDVDRSEDVSLSDTQVVFQRIDQSDTLDLPATRPDSDQYYDTSGDQRVTPLDALLIVNALNRYTDPISVTADLDVADDPNGNGVVIGDSMRLQGVTLPESRVDVFPANSADSAPVAQSVQSDSEGRFVVDVPLNRGLQTVMLKAVDPLGRTDSSSVTVRCTDLVTDWNAVILDVIRADRTPPPQAAKNMAMMHTAMFDAANAFNGTYESYLVGLSNAPSGSRDAAAAAAAYHVAKHLYPDSQYADLWASTFAESLSQIPDGSSKEASITFGYQVGEAMLTLRATDQSEVVSDYQSSSDPGRWRPTEPGFADGLLPQWPGVTPFTLDSADQFRPGPPPPMDSQAYADAVDEVMQIGGKDSTIRTAEQKEIGVFWADADGTFTPPGHWNQITGNVLIDRGLDLVDNARVFALVNLALADAGIAAWDAKYLYDLWRPIDAIRHADADGNDQTTADPNWTPEWINPPFPAYTSGHSSFSGAADAVLTSLFGDNVAFETQSDPASFDSIVTRSFDSFREAADEAGVSRIYGGIHFNFDNTAGLQAGRGIGQWVAQRVLKEATGVTA
ncbi:vanadium-dependent haloperoxidase [Neorhodopirellula pilleata]|uniref:PAP2 superfamily protein n=1 Tax=Neorhodopirellula pilleata TaxID=2714738 RepID=A0A5C5ZXV3_9BACT|nr:vanadium-dependent haloperoxidase [Neorhodopirellula pilleata]TWT91845.1 PAP2 superfamily protein [Neorhodopirellula pilleata]